VRAVTNGAAVVADHHLGVMIFAVRDISHSIHKRHRVVIVGKLELTLQLAIDTRPLAEYHKRVLELLLGRGLSEVSARSSEQLV
jgi:hypothetical protein